MTKTCIELAEWAKNAEHCLTDCRWALQSNDPKGAFERLEQAEGWIDDLDEELCRMRGAE